MSLLKTTVAITGGMALAAGVGLAIRHAAVRGEIRSTRDLPPMIRPTAAVELLELTFREHLNRAESVVLVKCVDRRVAHGPGQNVFTYYKFETREPLKGGARAVFELRLFGGTLGDTSVPLALDREFQIGSEYVLLLGANNADGYPTLDPGAIFVVQLIADLGRQVVVPGPGNLPLYNKTTGQPVTASADWAFLDDFIFSVKRAVR